MLVNGVKLEGPSQEVLVIPRQGMEIVFKAEAVLEYEEFDKLYPKPTPPIVMRPGGIKAMDPTDMDYQKKVDEWASKRTHWMILKSLSVSDSIKWETVNMSDPETWSNYDKELRQAGFTEGEITRIIQLVTSVNGLDQDKIDEATKRFLAGPQAQPEDNTSQNSEQNNTPSGEPAKESA